MSKVFRITPKRTKRANGQVLKSWINQIIKIMNINSNKTFKYMGVVLCVIVVFTAFSSYFYWRSDNAVGPNLITAFVGVVISALVTLVLLNGQTKDEEEKEKNIKVYEEKLRIYQEFLNCLYDVIKDGKVTNEEAIRLQFQTSYITMHTESKQIKNIAEQVKKIVENVQEDNNAQLMECLFEIVKEFKKELYPSNPTDKDSENITKAVESFSTIMDAVDVKGEEMNTEQVIETPTDLNDVLEKFTNDLIERVNANKDIWNVEKGELKDGIYVNYSWKGNEEGVRVLLDYEKNGDQYFQIHLDYDDTHEAYKHMKWRFGGRQNKWGWWKYLDTPIRNLKDTREIREHNWEGLANLLSDKFKALLTYVDSFERLHREIYQRAPRDKADISICYEKCVAFKYDKTLGEEKLFIDVELNEDGSYTIVVANRDNNTDLLLKRLNSIGFNVTNENLRNDKRFEAFTNVTADVVIEKINEINEKIQ